ncbi:MtrB/PioB family decaheme-associated outer membrane protein [Ferrimonas sediminicola]|uniref:MtrB/PioB family decaheme-associated outer membrane protein n=1 Tax=Ferrimonas sediminicola TaxID=2569538 RepID=A0A4U1BHH0_9GAMM|nr:MtrB/PioB family decaheme-associated outer membrane protein [Ferrimonas sediminicola]TKB50487.1 MtrB/PioB family decaheme-associated outer membrane protein [Ferrimonas sediminicola]
MKLNLITLAILTAAAPAMAADFSLSKANTDKVSANEWQCKRCIAPSELSGEIAIGAGYTGLDDLHAGNALGQEEDGAFGAINGRATANSDGGWRATTTAHNLGLDNGDAGVSASNGTVELHADYRQLNKLESDQASTPFYFSDDQLVGGEPYTPVLGIERNRISVGISATTSLAGLALDGDLGYRTEEKQGHKVVSVATPSPVNLAKPVDSRTDELTAATSVVGDNWLAALSYLGSVYDNDSQEVYHNTYGSLLAPEPDNETHQVTLSGNLRGQSGVFDGRVSLGRMIQDNALVNAQTSPIQSWDGQVDTLDMDARYTLMATSRLRLQLAGRYSERDNHSSSLEFPQYDFNATTGLVSENLLLDSEDTRASAKVQYRLAKGYRVDAGYQFDRQERSHSARETTDAHRLWAGVKITVLDLWQVALKGGISQRDGSRYQANDLSSSEENPLLRKYHLADRDRIEAEVKLRHQPMASLSVDLNLQFADDHYSDTEIGLTGASDYGYQLALSYLVNTQLSLYGFAGQQWINTDQRGDNWRAEINDGFVSLGAGFEYSGLLQDKLTLGGDYLFANSDSNSGAANGQFDDYYQYSHSVGLFAEYRLSPRSQLRLDYRYERYYDTDYASVAVDAVDGLITLGDLDHNYNAHQLMLSYSISL